MIKTVGNEIHIPLSKTKNILLSLTGIILIGIGFYIIFYLADNQSDYYPTYLKGVGVLTIVFFGWATLVRLKKLTDNKPGLILNERGIVDNSSAIKNDLIAWNDIKGIQEGEVNRSHFLILIVKNPEHYIDKITNPLHRKLMQINQKMFDSPLALTSTTLKCSFETLEKLIRSEWDKNRT